MIGLRVHELGHILPLLLRTPCRATCILPNPEAGNPTGYSLPNTRAKVLWRLFSLPRTGVQRGLDIPRKRASKFTVCNGVLSSERYLFVSERREEEKSRSCPGFSFTRQAASLTRRFVSLKS